VFAGTQYFAFTSDILLALGEALVYTPGVGFQVFDTAGILKLKVIDQTGFVGPQGIQGIQGIQGLPGTNGTNGNDGAPGTPGAFVNSNSPGSFTIPTNSYAVMSRRLQLTGAQRATLQGTGRLRIS